MPRKMVKFPKLFDNFGLWRPQSEFRKQRVTTMLLANLFIRYTLSELGLQTFAKLLCKSSFFANKANALILGNLYYVCEKLGKMLTCSSLLWVYYAAKSAFVRPLAVAEKKAQGFEKELLQGVRQTFFVKVSKVVKYEANFSWVAQTLIAKVGPTN